MAVGVIGAVAVVLVILVYARYRRDIGAARERVQDMGSQVIETDCGPIEYATYGEGDPVLVVHGESDPLPKEAPTSVHRNLAQSEFLVLKNTGHFMFIEALDELISAIRIFFEKKFPD